jgi:hypothetical protein
MVHNCRRLFAGSLANPDPEGSSHLARQRRTIGKCCDLIRLDLNQSVGRTGRY